MKSSSISPIKLSYMSNIFNISLSRSYLTSRFATFINGINKSHIYATRSLSSELSSRLAISIDSWIESRGYTQRRVTINDLATIVTYHCSFRVWVSKLRIERAKELLEGTASIVDIALMSGFSSPALFSQTFRHYEMMSPTEWRLSKIK